MKTKEDVFEELIATVERNAIDNEAHITNVKLWASSWRREYANQSKEWNSLEIVDNVAEDCKAYMEQHGGYHKFDEYFDYYLSEAVKKKLGIETH